MTTGIDLKSPQVSRKFIRQIAMRINSFNAISAGTTLLTGLAILFLLISKQGIPSTDFYIFKKDLSYTYVYLLVAICGLALFVVARKKCRNKTLRVFLYALSLALIFALPLLMFIGYTVEYWKYRLRLIALGFLPFLFAFIAYLILAGKRVFSLLMAVFFFIVCLSYSILAVKIAPKVGKAFSTYSTSDLYIILGTIILSFVFGFLNLKAFKARHA